MSYIGIGAEENSLDAVTKNSNYLIFGKHGTDVGGEYRYGIDESKLRGVIFADDELVEYADIDFGNAALLSPRQGEKKVKFALVLR